MANLTVVKALLEESQAEVKDLEAKATESAQKISRLDYQLNIVIAARTSELERLKAEETAHAAMLAKGAIPQAEHDEAARAIEAARKAAEKKGADEEAALRGEAKPILDEVNGTVLPAMRIAKHRVAFYEKRLAQ